MSRPGSISGLPDGAPPENPNVRGNGLLTEGPPWGLQHLHDYVPGGHHPVHLGDVIQERYKVLYKLGSGGYSNVWLCSDATGSGPRYVALKIVLAAASTPECPELRVSKLADLGLGESSFCLPLDHFDMQGPNGVHYVFVYPVLGPRVS